MKKEKAPNKDKPYQGLFRKYVISIYYIDYSQYLSTINNNTEGSHSGLVHYLGKVAYLNRYREFESHTLRQITNFEP